MDNHDKIYSAYIGEMGEAFQKTTLQRIQWIIDNLGRDQRILDVGCSQGIITILAAQKSGYACGVDINEEGIDFARQLVKEKYPEEAEHVEFFCDDFLSRSFPASYDRILMTEILEHLPEPRLFLERAKEILKEEGKLIVTVPFGINDHPDHVNTFYFTNILELFEGLFYVNHMEFQGRWMGIVASLKENKFGMKEALARFESNIYTIDREMTDRITSLYNTVNLGSSRYKDSLANYTKLKEWYNNALEKKEALDKQCKAYQVEKEALDKQCKVYRAEKEALDKQCKVYQAEKEALDKQCKVYQAEKEALDKQCKVYQAEKETLDKQCKVYRAEKEALDKQCKVYREQKKILEIQCGKLSQEIRQEKEKEKQLKEILLQCRQNITKDIEILELTKTETQRILIQLDYLKRENAECRRKLAKITDTWYGRLALKGYKVIKRIVRAIKGV